MPIKAEMRPTCECCGKVAVGPDSFSCTVSKLELHYHLDCFGKLRACPRCAEKSNTMMYPFCAYMMCPPKQWMTAERARGKKQK